MILPKLVIGGRELETPIIQGGMGVNISRPELVEEIVRLGGLGTLSMVFMDRIYELETGKKTSLYDAVKFYVTRTKQRTGGHVGINTMIGLRDYKEGIQAAVDAVDFLFMGAGLPTGVPEIIGKTTTGLIPIVSSARSLDVICRKWVRYDVRPAAAVYEGPPAGGHLGFKPVQLMDPAYSMEKEFKSIKEVAKIHGDFPVIVAGGIWSHDDIARWILLGADGVQLGTRFVATYESGASDMMKQMLIDCQSPDDIVIAHNDFGLRQSPVGHPFRVLKNSPGLPYRPKDPAECEDCPVDPLQCRALSDPEKYFCIGAGLMSAQGNGRLQDMVVTIGANGWRIKKRQSAEEVFHELRCGIEAA